MDKENNTNINKKTSRKIFAEVSNERVQFWVSALKNKKGQFALVCTNLPTKAIWTNADGEAVAPESEGAIKSYAVRQTETPEHIGIGLQAVRAYAQEKDFGIVAFKVTYEPMSKKMPRVIEHEVTPVNMGDYWSFDLERKTCYIGGFPEGTIAGKACADQLAAAIGSLEDFVGEKGSLTDSSKSVKKSTPRSKLREEINSLGAAFEAAEAE